MLQRARDLHPVPAIALQITGGEPLLRNDLIDIVRLAKEIGFKHVQVNTQGIGFVSNPDLAVKLRKAGVNVLYMSFDGVTPYTNPKNHWEIPYILEALKKASLPVVLVPTIIKGYNDHELGKMIEFGLKHINVVRGVNMQPISLTGRVPRSEREKVRITIPDAIIKIEEQTDGAISRDDWYPVPTAAPFSHFVESLTGRPQLTLTTHFACGAATYIFKEDDGKIIPITRFVDVKELMDNLEKLSNELRLGANKYMILIKTLNAIRRSVDLNKAPKRLRKRGLLIKLLYNILIKHDYSSLGEFHYKTLFLGMMHFQDLYNHDVARVQRCEIHYITPDGRLVPFCSFNVLQDLYRDRVQSVYGISLSRWKKLTRKDPLKDKYVRNIRKLISNPLYREYYEGIIDIDSIPYEDHVMASKKFGVPVVE